jgi:hypothetical protein
MTVFRGDLTGHDRLCRQRFHLCLKCTCEKGANAMKDTPDNCAHCGGRASFGSPPIGFQIECNSPKCATTSGLFPTKPMVLSAWNKRAVITEWQPIDTAPKDGTDILAIDNAVQGGFHQVVFYNNEGPGPYRWHVADGPAYPEGFFTHWKPLDKTPSEMERDK